MLTREGGHHANRIVHAGGDATGAEVQRALHDAVHRDPWIRLVEHALVLDLLRDADGRACGRHPARARRGRRGRRRRDPRPRGRAGHRRHGPDLRRPPPTRRSPPATASRSRCAPARPSPTSSSSSSTRPRSSAADVTVGASSRWSARRCAARARTCVDDDGKRFMVGQHELAELAPRDVVAKGIHRVHARRPAPTTSGSTPGTSAASSSSSGSRRSWRPAGRPASTRPTDLIPVAPAAHYASGGVRTDLHGRTLDPRACTRAARSPAPACTAPTGWPRNSLLEGLVFARRIADDIARDLPPQADPVAPAGEPGWAVPTRRSAAELQRRDDPRRRGAAQRRLAGRDGQGAGPARRAARRARATRPGRRPTCSPWRARWSPRPPTRGRRPAAATGARTSPTPPTSGAATCSTAIDRGRASADPDAASEHGQWRSPTLASGLDPAEVERIVDTRARRGSRRPAGGRRDQRGHHPGRPDRHRRPGRPGRRRGRRAGGRRARSSRPPPAARRRSSRGVDGRRPRSSRGDVLATVTGPTRALLTAERTALNLLCRMSGVATHTRALGRRAGRHQGDRAGHPQDHARACAPWRSTRSGPAAAPTSAWASTTSP